MNELILGDGLLGSEIIKQTGWNYLSTKKDDINILDGFTELCAMIDDIGASTIINCIGYTKTYDTERQNHWDVNYGFVANLCDFCDSRSIKLVHISTDYIYANSGGGSAKKETDIPVHQETWYSYCKLLADAYVQLRASDYLMVRCSFKPKPFPYDKAFINVAGNFDYVDVLAKQIIDLVNEERSGIWNIGTEFKTVYTLAQQTKPEIIGELNYKLPIIEMDLSKFNSRK